MAAKYSLFGVGFLLCVCNVPALESTSEQFVLFRERYCQAYPQIKSVIVKDVQQCCVQCLIQEGCFMISFIENKSNSGETTGKCILHRFNDSIVIQNLDNQPIIFSDDFPPRCYGMKTHHSKVCNDQVSVSLGKPAFQSSTYKVVPGRKSSTYLATNAVDGIREDPGDNKFILTDYLTDSDRPWWMVDLQRSFDAYGFGIVNRNRSHSAEHLHYFEVRVGMEDPRTKGNNLSDNILLYYYNDYSIGTGEYFFRNFPSEPARGRYFSIQIISLCNNCIPQYSFNAITLIEVDVFGCPSD